MTDANIASDDNTPIESSNANENNDASSVVDVSDARNACKATLASN